MGEYVSLKRAGADSMKGLCPFHDEKSPSFHVRPNHSHFHCFGCGESGDVFAFLQKMEHVGFVEAVEQLADQIGYQINYEGGGTSVQRDRGTRARLVAANAAAHEFYQAQLRDPAAEAARKYLTERNFDAGAAQQFGCGYAPAGWDMLTKHLLRKGFEIKELEAAGLSKPGRRGPIDRFHRRLLWPIRNLSGDVIGFGARRLFDDDHDDGQVHQYPGNGAVQEVSGAVRPGPRQTRYRQESSGGGGGGLHRCDGDASGRCHHRGRLLWHRLR